MPKPPLKKTATSRPSGKRTPPKKPPFKKSPTRKHSSRTESPRKGASWKESPKESSSKPLPKPPFRTGSSRREPVAREPVSREPVTPKPSVKRAPIREREFTVYGWNACRSVFEKRPEDILRAFFSAERERQFRLIKNWCAERKLPYRKLDNESLTKVAASVHHEGCVMVVRPLKLPSVYEWMDAGLGANQFAMALDRVDNPHNVGAILRSCAYFGARGLLAGVGGGATAINSSAVRMAEGALEKVPVLECKSLPSILRDLKSKGVFIAGADPDSKTNLDSLKLRLPCVMVVGNEQEGLSEVVRKRCDALVRIPGTGGMESLNVSVAAGILLAELARQAKSSQRRKK